MTELNEEFLNTKLKASSMKGKKIDKLYSIKITKFSSMKKNERIRHILGENVRRSYNWERTCIQRTRKDLPQLNTEYREEGCTPEAGKKKSDDASDSSFGWKEGPLKATTTALWLENTAAARELQRACPFKVWVSLTLWRRDPFTVRLVIAMQSQVLSVQPERMKLREAKTVSFFCHDIEDTAYLL